MRCACSKRYASSAWKRKPVSIRPPLRNSTAWCRRPRRRNHALLSAQPLCRGQLYAYWITINYREAYGIYACNGILFNHESPVRGETFVTRKITRALARIKLGLQDCVFLGNLNARRDWGHARDYVEMQWLMLQQEVPEDYVIATGVQYSVRDFVDAAAAELGIAVRWEGQGLDEKGYDADGNCIVSVDARYFRPTEVETLLGDPSKAKNKLGWTPKITFHGSGRRDDAGRPQGGRAGRTG